eukprot:s1_g2395.t1
MPQRLLQRTIKVLPAPAAGNRITYDTELKGFGVRVTKSGAKSFILNYRANGRERRITIGKWPEWTVTAARKQAEELKRSIDVGHDPMGERHEERQAITISQLCELYVERHLPKKRDSSIKNDLSLINRIVSPKLGSRKAATITHSELERLHRELTQTAPYRANRTIALLSKMFNLAIRWGLTEDNPAQGIEKNPENRRERYLTKDELARLSAALAEHPRPHSANAIRLLLLTGARRGEVLSARWGDFDLSEGIWTKPSSHTKQKKIHRVPLSGAATDLLREMKKNSESEFLFPGTDIRKPLTDIKKTWESLRRKAEIEDVRLHDLRHTYASLLASSGVSLPIIGALLGHTQAQTTARYAHLLDDPLRKATEVAASVVAHSSTRKSVKKPH